MVTKAVEADIIKQANDWLDEGASREVVETAVKVAYAQAEREATVYEHLIKLNGLTDEEFVATFNADPVLLDPANREIVDRMKITKVAAPIVGYPNPSPATRQQQERPTFSEPVAQRPADVSTTNLVASDVATIAKEVGIAVARAIREDSSQYEIKYDEKGRMVGLKIGEDNAESNVDLIERASRGDEDAQRELRKRHS